MKAAIINVSLAKKLKDRLPEIDYFIWAGDWDPPPFKCPKVEKRVIIRAIK